MPLWTTYLSNWARNKTEILTYLQAHDMGRGVLPKFVMLDRGNNAVAPTKEILAQYKNGQASWSAYQLTYAGLLLSDEAYDWMSEVYNECFSTPAENVILICFEKNPEHCHRRLLAEKIKALFPEIDYKGELPNHFQASREPSK